MFKPLAADVPGGRATMTPIRGMPMSDTPRRRLARGSGWAVVVLVLVGAGLAITIATGAWKGLFPPEPVTAQAREISSLYDIVFWLAAIVFFLVEGLILWSVIRYRRRPGDDELPPQTHGSNLAEVTWTLIPVVVVLFLFFVSWRTLNSIEQVSANPDITVRVNGAQFQWTFDYLDANGEVVFSQAQPTGDGGGLVLPVEQKVKLELYSPDVIHSFYVPQFLYKRDVNPDASGRMNVFEIQLEESFVGQTMRGQCAELCGIGHRAMLFDVHALSAADFAAWREQKIAEANATPAPTTSAGPPAVTLDVTAKDIAFDTHALDVPAGQPFAITLTNDDPEAVTHDVDIRTESGDVLADQQDIPGGTSMTYNYAALDAGTYTFICSIHPVPAMTGTLTVK